MLHDQSVGGGGDAQPHIFRQILPPNLPKFADRPPNPWHPPFQIMDPPLKRVKYVLNFSIALIIEHLSTPSIKVWHLGYSFELDMFRSILQRNNKKNRTH